jgi:hypothetical protein
MTRRARTIVGVVAGVLATAAAASAQGAAASFDALAGRIQVDLPGRDPSRASLMVAPLLSAPVTGVAISFGF